MADLGWSTNTDWENAQSSEDININSGTFELADAIPESGVSRWTFDDTDTQNGSAIDVWGGHDGSINGPQTGQSGASVNYSTGESYYFDDGGGSGDEHISVPHDPELMPDNLSVSCWINTSGASDRYQRIVTKGGFSNENGYGLTLDGESIYVNVYADNRIATIAGTITYDNWHHLAFTYGGDTVTIYNDGSEVDQNSSSSGDITSNTVPLMIGNEYDTLDDPVNGRIDDVRIYDKALSASEIDNLYNTGSING